MLNRLLCTAVCCALLLPGCTESTDSQDAETTGAGTNPIIESLSTDGWYRVPAYTGTPLIEPDPDRQVYFSLSGRDDCDFYPDLFSSGVSFDVFTREHVATGDIKVRLAAETGCDTSVHEWTDGCRTLAYNGIANLGLDNYHYLALKGIDWREYAQLGSDSREASGIYAEHLEKGEINLSNMEYWGEFLSKYTDPYDELRDAYEAEYEAFPTDELPQFYYYSVYISFSDYHDETVSSVDVSVAGETYTFDIGEWRIHSKTPDELRYDYKPEGLTPGSISVPSIQQNPYCDGYAILSFGMNFTAKKDITLTSLKAENTVAELLGGKVQYRDANQNITMDYFWDGKQPIDIPAGTNVVIDAYVHNERFREYEVNCTTTLTMNYEIDGKQATAMSYCVMRRYNKPWDTYLMAFHGYDIGEYYVCYGNRYDPKTIFSGLMYDSLPEAWRR